MKNVEQDSQTYGLIGCLITGGTPDISHKKGGRLI